MANYVFQIEGMHCGSCALLIDDTLEDLPGVRSSSTSAKQRRSNVELDPAATGASDVITAIEELGYHAVLVS